MASQPPQTRDLQSYVQVIVRRKLTIVLVTIVVLAIGLIVTFAQAPTYTATAQVLLPAEPVTSALQPASNQIQPTSDDLQRQLADAQQFAKGDETKKLAATQVHHDADVHVGISTSADILTFTYDSGHADDAATTANVYANAFIKAFVDNEVAQYTGQITALQSSIAGLQAQIATGSFGPQRRAAAVATISSLTQALQQLEAASHVVQNTTPTLIQAATAPASPSSPKTGLNAALALFVGLFLGVAAAFVRDRVDDKIESFRDVEESSGGRPVIGTLPVVEAWRKDDEHHLALLEDGGSPAAEAYRVVRTSIQFLGIEERQRVIGITSAAPGEGKSTVVANLAVSFASAGLSVVAVSFDFRRSSLHKFFGLDNETGATSVLLGQAPIDQAIHRVPAQPDLRVLTSGPVPPNPAEILSLPRVERLVETLAADADIVLIDCPPTLPVTDTLLISRLCESMYVLAVASGTKRVHLQRVYHLLDQVGAPVRGTIINRVSTGRAAGGYGYDYGYGYEGVSGAVAPALAPVPVPSATTIASSAEPAPPAPAPDPVPTPDPPPAPVPPPAAPKREASEVGVAGTAAADQKPARLATSARKRPSPSAAPARKKPPPAGREKVSVAGASRRNGTAGNGSASAVRKGSTGDGSNGTARHGPARNGAVQDSSARNGTARNGSARNGSNGAARNGGKR